VSPERGGGRGRAMAFVGGGSDVVVSTDGEGLLQLREVDGVPFCGSTRVGARQVNVEARAMGAVASIPSSSGGGALW
jgi:hypothetical protein